MTRAAASRDADCERPPEAGRGVRIAMAMAVVVGGERMRPLFFATSPKKRAGDGRVRAISARRRGRETRPDFVGRRGAPAARRRLERRRFLRLGERERPFEPQWQHRLEP